MSHECEECGKSFDTLSRLRLHKCSSELDSASSNSAPSEESAVENEPPIEEEYPDLVGELPSLVDDAKEGDLPALYSAIAKYETVLDRLPSSGGARTEEPYHDIRWAYYKPLADGLDAAAQAHGWDILTEFMDAYHPHAKDELPEVGHVIGNAVGRSIVRTRLSSSVGAIPVQALTYLGAIPDYVDESAVAYEESHTYGWGIGHPDHSVSKRLHALADTEHRWVSITLETAFYATNTQQLTASND